MSESYSLVLLRTEYGAESHSFVFSALADDNELFQLTLEMPAGGAMDEQIAAAFDAAAGIARALADSAEAKAAELRA